MTKLRELKDADTGVYEVLTFASRHVVDLDARTITRHPGEGPGTDELPASTLRRDAAPVHLIALAHCRIGDPMTAFVQILDPATGVVTERTTTPVLGIRPVGP